MATAPKRQKGPGPKSSTRKPSQRDSDATATTEKGGPDTESTTKAMSLTVLSGAAMALDDSSVYRPASHLAPSDIQFISKDKKSGYALHSFVLRLRGVLYLMLF